MRSTALCAMVAGWLWLGGCSGTKVIINASAITPITHQPERGSVPRTIGLLRRLAVLPARMEFTPENPKRCMGPCDWDRVRLDTATNVPAYLSESRGYEVLVLDPLLADHASVELPGASLDDFVKELETFAEQHSSEAPPEHLAHSVRLIGRQLWVDGIVLVRGSVVLGTWTEAALGFALGFSGYGLLAALPIQMARVGSKFEAFIFETALGKLAWASVYSASGNPFAEAPSVNKVITELFDPIEPALPKVMTSTIEPVEEKLEGEPQGQIWESD